MEDFVGRRAPLYEVKANLFKGLAHPVRIRVLELLAEAPERAVTELLAETGLEPSNLSQHLAVMRRYHLVTAERRGLQVFYALASPRVADLLAVARGLLQEMLEATREQLEYSAGAPAAPAAAAGAAR